MTRVATTAATLAVIMLLGAGSTASGQSAHEQHHPQGAPAPQGMPMQPGPMGQGMGPGMMGPGMMSPGMMGQGMGSGMGPGMMGPGMHPGMMGQMPGMMGQMPGMMGQMGPGMMGQMGPGMMGQMGPGMMGPGMMGPGMMGPGMHPGMMGQGGHGMGPGMMGPGMMGQGLHGLRVVPMMHLSTDDVRQFLQRHISAHGLTHLQVGEVTQSDDETITADIVTQEGSLALRLEIDAYTGFVKSVS